jgi:hypothetical protein
MNSSTSNSKPLKKYLAGFLLLILFIFLFDRCLYFLVYSIETHMFYSKSKFEEYLSRYVKDKDYSALLLGTSRTYEGILPAYLQVKLKQKIFKEAHQGVGPKYNYYFYNMYKKHAGIPKIVIYGVDYFIYTIKSEAKWMSRFDIKTRPKIGIFSSPLLLVKNKKDIDILQNSILVTLQENKPGEEMEQVFKELTQIQEYMGANPANQKLVTKETPGYLHQDFPLFPGEEGPYFVKLMDELDRDGVTVFLVALPDYYGSFKTNVQLKDFINNLKTYRLKHKKLTVLNYNHMDRFPLNNPDYFLDGGYGKTNSHLSAAGARIFSERLSEDIKKYYK